MDVAVTPEDPIDSCLLILPIVALKLLLHPSSGLAWCTVLWSPGRLIKKDIYLGTEERYWRI